MHGWINHISTKGNFNDISFQRSCFKDSILDAYLFIHYFRWIERAWDKRIMFLHNCSLKNLLSFYPFFQAAAHTLCQAFVVPAETKTMSNGSMDLRTSWFTSVEVIINIHHCQICDGQFSPYRRLSQEQTRTSILSATCDVGFHTMLFCTLWKCMHVYSEE